LKNGAISYLIDVRIMAAIFLEDFLRVRAQWIAEANQLNI